MVGFTTHPFDCRSRSQFASFSFSIFPPFFAFDRKCRRRLSLQFVPRFRPRRTSRLIKGSCELQRRSGKVENFGYSDSRDSDNHLQWQLFWSHKEDLLMLKVIGQRDNRQHWHVCQFPPVSLLPKLSCRVIYGTLCSPNPKKIRQQWVIVTFLNDNSLMVPRTIRYTLNHLAEGMEAR